MLMTDTLKRDRQAIEDFITIDEAVRHSGYTGQYLRRMARQGRIRALKWGHMWMIDLQSLQAYIDRAESLGAEDKRFGPREVEE